MHSTRATMRRTNDNVNILSVFKWLRNYVWLEMVGYSVRAPLTLLQFHINNPHATGAWMVIESFAKSFYAQ